MKSDTNINEAAVARGASSSTANCRLQFGGPQVVAGQERCGGGNVLKIGEVGGAAAPACCGYAAAVAGVCERESGREKEILVRKWPPAAWQAAATEKE